MSPNFRRKAAGVQFKSSIFPQTKMVYGGGWSVEGFLYVWLNRKSYQLSVINYPLVPSGSRPSALSRFRLSASATTCAISEAIQ